jgi:spoIIIJ-associated protein
MASNLEFEGKNIDEAVDIACETLNMSKKQLKYEVISHGSTGIFGLVGAKKARINVQIPHTLPKESDEKITEQTENKTSVEKAPLLHEDNEKDEEDSKLVGLGVLTQLVNFITDGTEISVREYNHRILYDVIGGDSAAIIGKRGQTLDAIQYIVEKVVNKKSEERVRLQVDVEGYLQKKRFGLQKFALRLAEKTKYTGKAWTTGLMNAHDRRVVHIALRGDHDVMTKSLGDGFLRKMVIIPRKGPQRREPFDDRR